MGIINSYVLHSKVNYETKASIVQFMLKITEELLMQGVTQNFTHFLENIPATELKKQV